MSRYIHTESAQLLDQTPDFRAVRRDFLRDLGATYYDGRVLRQQTHNTTEANVGRLGITGFRGQTDLACTSCFGFLDAGIMR
jgi:hypothetical protein